ncbi:MAG TPA: hypothetical protein VJ483_09245, partial [Holophagaceae bacterium]|nr:hypothetical protein [Holophagaceae bacterium]
LLLVSHDRFFLDQVATHTLAWNPGSPRWELYEGNPTTVRELRAARAAAAAAPAPGSRLPASEAKRETAPKVKKAGLSQKEQRRLTEVEALMESIHGRIASLELMLAEPTAFLTASSPGHEALKQRDAAKAELETLELEWMELEEKRG